MAEAAWRRRRRWGELSIAAAAGGGLVGLVCYQLYGDPRPDPARAPSEGADADAEPEEPPRGRGLLPIPVAAAKETVGARARARGAPSVTSAGRAARCPTCVREGRVAAVRRGWGSGPP